MIVNLSAAASDIMLDTLSALMDGGSIELLSETENVLAVLNLPVPAAFEATGGRLEFNEIANENAALATGSAKTARILAADGSEVFSCDVGDQNSDAVIKFRTAMIYRGDPVAITSFKLVMP